MCDAGPFALLSAAQISDSPSRRDRVSEALEDRVLLKSVQVIYGTMEGFIAMEQRWSSPPAADS